MQQRISMTDRAHKKSHVLLLCLVLLTGALVVYEPVRHNAFISYDDPRYVTDNAHVYNGIAPNSIFWVFTTARASNWYPLTWLSHILDCQILGLNRLAHHLTSLLFHPANTLPLFFILKKMTGAPWPPAFVATDLGSCREVIADKETDFLVNNVDQAVEVIGRLDQVDRRNCRKYVEQDFTIERMVEGYEKVYEQIFEIEASR
jgi:hypothetical protein